MKIWIKTILILFVITVFSVVTIMTVKYIDDITTLPDGFTVTAHSGSEGTPDNSVEFLKKAIALVEKNLGKQYTVEQLSSDLCMERTGLYKKLSAIVDKSPSLFMRSIRLSHAARLIREGNHSLAEIATKTGFSSASYLSRCFQEEYGCKPSEYARQ
jgi:transcriptional regulator GlxA family with amidase domain